MRASSSTVVASFSALNISRMSTSDLYNVAVQAASASAACTEICMRGAQAVAGYASYLSDLAAMSEEGAYAAKIAYATFWRARKSANTETAISVNGNKYTSAPASSIKSSGRKGKAGSRGKGTKSAPKTGDAALSRDVLIATLAAVRAELRKVTDERDVLLSKLGKADTITHARRVRPALRRAA
jgi:hypothetical protein